jgi:hypothetical protein
MKSVLLATALLLTACADVAITPDTRSIDWLTGCWRAERADGYYEEAWLPPTADGTVGVSREVRGGRTTAWEFLKIELRGGGVIAYIAQPSGQARAEFLMSRHEPGRLVFENREHDYPTLIEYRYRELNVLTAHIEGANGARSVDYPMQRIDCDG